MKHVATIFTRQSLFTMQSSMQVEDLNEEMVLPNSSLNSFIIHLIYSLFYLVKLINYDVNTEGHAFNMGMDHGMAQISFLKM